jgi:hypothetical protein
MAKRKKSKKKSPKVVINNPVAKHMHDAGGDCKVHKDRKKESKINPDDEYHYQEEW